MRWISALVLSCAAAAPAVALEPVSLSTDFDPFVTTAAATKEAAVDLVECCDLCRRKSGGKSPWTFNFIQTSDYGTSLALPISLTPANTLLAPTGNPAAAGILNVAQAGNLGLLGNLGLAPVPPGTNVVGVFEDDFQFQTTAATQYQRAVGEYGTFTASYNYYQNLHPDVKQLDLMSHTPGAQFALRLTERITTATYYNYSYYFLSGSSFVSQNRVGMLSTFRANDLWDFTSGVNYANANFRNANFLNSDNYASTLEATRYQDSLRNNYLRLGFGTGYSDAQLSGFTYSVNNIYMVTRFLYGDGNRNEVRLNGSYGFYDFKGPDPIQQTVFRADNIWTAGIFYGRRLSDNVQLFAQYTYLNSNSNVARQLYNSDLISLGLNYLR